VVTVHGLWSRRQVLCLWTDAPVLPAAREALAARAPALAAALGAPARGVLELLLPTADGVPRHVDGPVDAPVVLAPWRLRVVALNPDRAAAVLAEVTALGPEPEPGPALVLADDLRHLAEVAACVRARVDAAHVVPDLVHDDGAWWGRWAPLPDAAWRAWRSGAAAAMPPVLRAEVTGERAEGERQRGRSAVAVVDELCAELTDLLVARRLREAGLLAEPELGSDAGREPATGGDAVSAWVASLLSGQEVAGAPAVLADLAARARRWRGSGTSSPVELVLRVTEPPDPDDDAAGTTGGPLAPSGWTLQVRLRSLDDPSLVLTPEEVRAGVGGVDWPLEADPWAYALTELARAGAVYPPLLEEIGAQPGADASMGVQALLDLVGRGAPLLSEAGVAVQLPGRWLRPQVGLRLHAHTSAAAQEGTAVPQAADAAGRLGADQLVEYSWKVALGSEELTQAELEAMVAARSPLVRLRGRWVEVDAERVARSLRFLQRAGTGSAGLGGVLGQVATAKDLPAPVTGITATGWLGDLLDGRGEQALEPVPPPAGLRAQLRPYQERGVAWLAFMARHGLGVVLADDMGLGKTVQLLALQLHEQEDAARRGQGVAPTLLVCPMSVVGNWQREAARFAPGLRVHVHHGPERLHGEALAEAVAASDLVLTTYALLARDADDLAPVAWRRVALDEAQHVKNPGTRAARAVRSVAGAPCPPGGTHRVALTGTPVENRLGELHALLDFTSPGLLGSAAGFRERFAVPVERHRDATAGRLLTTLTRPFVLRRVKTDPSVISDLPEKLEMVVRANLTAEQASLYQAVVEEMLAQVDAADGVQRKGLVLATLTRLKQVCNHPAQYLGDGSSLLRRGQHRSGKLALVDDVLDAVVADGERALCFTQYREFGSMLVPHLSARYGAPVPFLHGGVPRAARDAMVSRFSADDGPPVMLLSLKAGGTGLNLTAANHVVHLDRWWNPAVEAQATDRAYRIGQQRQVQVRKLVCVGTVEERIDALMTSKAELADLVVGTGEGWLTELSTDALRELLVLGADAVGD